MGLITLAEAGNVVGADETSSEFSGVATQLIAAATAAVNKYCDRDFEWAERTEYHDGRGLDWLYVKNAPITDSSGVETRDTTDLTVWDDIGRDYEDLDKVDSDDMVIADPEHGLIRFVNGESLSDGVQNVKVVYYGGYKAADIPQDVRQACILLVQEWYIHRGYRRTDRVGGVGPLDYPATPTTVALPDEVVNLLMPWRRTLFATGWEG